MKLLVRNKVEDVAQWRRVFDEQDAAGRAAGIRVDHVWQDVDEPQQVYFMLDVEDRARAEAYMAQPESADVGKQAGVIDGEVRFLVELEGKAF